MVNTLLKSSYNVDDAERSNGEANKFSVTNYRSITTAHNIQMNNMTVLVGKNNEGKSNILRALSLAMDIMRLYADNPRVLNMPDRVLKKRYDWDRDYPISLQGRYPNGHTLISLSFQLTEGRTQEHSAIYWYWPQ